MTHPIVQPDDLQSRPAYILRRLESLSCWPETALTKPEVKGPCKVCGRYATDQISDWPIHRIDGYVNPKSHWCRQGLDGPNYFRPERARLGLLKDCSVWGPLPQTDHSFKFCDFLHLRRKKARTLFCFCIVGTCLESPSFYTLCGPSGLDPPPRVSSPATQLAL